MKITKNVEVVIDIDNVVDVNGKRLYDCCGFNCCFADRKDCFEYHYCKRYDPKRKRHIQMMTNRRLMECIKEFGLKPDKKKLD